MSQLMACSLDGSILYFPSNFRSEISSRLVFMGKVRMMSCITLDANSPTLLCHSKYKSPPILRIQVSVRQHKQALVLLKLDVRFEIVEDLAGMELFDSCVRANSRLHYFLLLKDIEAALKTVFVLAFAIFILFHPYSTHPSEKYLKYRLHIIHKHFLEILLLFIQLWVFLFLPHFIYDAFINIPISDMRQKVLQ